MKVTAELLHPVVYGGAVSARSEDQGVGSNFTVEPPAAVPSGASTPINVEPDAASVRESRGRVLVVEDHVDSAEMLRGWLKKKGYDARVAHDGREALVEVARFDPDFVLLDIGLPVMDGFEVARRLRLQARERPAPLLVAITGYGQAKDRERTRQEGFYAHMLKPVDLSAITDLLAKGNPLNPDFGFGG